MKRIGCTLALSLLFVGCSQPSETVPSVTGTGDNSATSGVTDDLDLDASSEAPPSGDGASKAGFSSLRYC